jgi:hypothetical protein
VQKEENKMSHIKEGLIHRLQEEIIFIQESKENDDFFDRYQYKLKGDLSESRDFNG